MMMGKTEPIKMMKPQEKEVNPNHDMKRSGEEEPGEESMEGR